MAIETLRPDSIDYPPGMPITAAVIGCRAFWLDDGGRSE